MVGEQVVKEAAAILALVVEELELALELVQGMDPVPVVALVLVMVDTKAIHAVV